MTGCVYGGVCTSILEAVILPKLRIVPWMAITTFDSKEFKAQESNPALLKSK